MLLAPLLLPMLLPMDSPSLLLLLLCAHNDVRFILRGGGGRGRFSDDLEGDDLEGDDLHDEACDEVELVADIVDGDNGGGDGDDVSPFVLLRRGGVECVILFGIVMHRCTYIIGTIRSFHSYN